MFRNSEDGFQTVHVGRGDNTNTNEDILPSYEPPTLAAARDFYNMSLPRRIKDPKQPTGYRLANVGEFENIETKEPSQLYDVWQDSSVMNDFGIGVALYFKSLKALFIVLFLCAFISLAAMYHNKDFNPDEDSIERDKLNYPDEDEPQPTPTYLIGTVYGADRDSLSVSSQGASDIACCVIFCLFAVISGYLEKREVEAIDISQQTTQDYSVYIENPPKNITDPQEYFEFFSRFGEVVFITIALNNGSLIQAMAEKKVISELLTSLSSASHENAQLVTSILAESKMENKGSRVETYHEEGKTETLNLFQKIGLSPTIKSSAKRLHALDNMIQGLSLKDYSPWRVYVTFNTEHAQRNCLSCTNVGKYALLRKLNINEAARFKGETLQILEAVEPSDVIYENSDHGYFYGVFTIICSYFLCACLLVASFFVIKALANKGNVEVAIFISLINVALPTSITYITETVEIHHDTKNLQWSMLFKLVIARCVNSALLIYLATPYSVTFDLDKLSQIQNILIADAISTPIFRLMNIPDILKRYVFTPMTARTQEEFNSAWQGADWNLAERYTDILKTIFVGLFFSVPIPSGLFITAFSMLSTYAVDKYSLMRIWKRSPMIGASLGVLSRYFYILIVFGHLSISRIFFANWPYRGLWNQDTGQEADCNFFQCDVNNDMTADQKGVVKTYSVAVILMFTLVLFWFIFFKIGKMVKHFIYGSTDVVGDASAIHLRDIANGIQAYVPVVRRDDFISSLICADISKIPMTYVPVRREFDDTTDPQDYSVFNDEQFPHSISANEWAYLFGKIKYFPDPKLTFQSPPIAAYNISNNPQQATNLPVFLPTGWEARMTDDGKPYYVDHNNKTTHWSLPASISNNVKSPMQATTNQVHQAAAPRVPSKRNSLHLHVRLPPGWEMRMTPTGRPYYVDHNTRRTYWDLPHV